MKEKTAVEELLSLIPSGQDIMAYISDNNPDEKMLDEWMWERVYKGRDWIGKNRQQIEEAYKRGCQDTYGNDEPSSQDPEDEKSASDYYQQTYGNENV